MQPTQTLQSPPPSGGRRRRVVDEDPDERRRKFLERNRAAATRCRQKRKVWVMSLEKKAEELTQTNMQLQVDAFSKPLSHVSKDGCLHGETVVSDDNQVSHILVVMEKSIHRSQQLSID